MECYINNLYSSTSCIRYDSSPNHLHIKPATVESCNSIFTACQRPRTLLLSRETTLQGSSVPPFIYGVLSGGADEPSATVFLQYQLDVPQIMQIGIFLLGEVFNEGMGDFSTRKVYCCTKGTDWKWGFCRLFLLMVRFFSSFYQVQQNGGGE